MRNLRLRHQIRRRLLVGGPRAAALGLVCVCVLAAPLTAGADSQAQMVLSPALEDAAESAPDASFRVIVQSGESSVAAADAVRSAVDGESSTSATDSAPIARSFTTVPGVAATLTGAQLTELADSSAPLVVTLDTPMTISSEPADSGPPADEITGGLSGPPVQTSAVGILGTAERRQRLSAIQGTWAGTAPFDFSYQWRRCDATGGSCTDIVGANEETYRLTRDDIGATVRLLLTVRNIAGEVSALSEPTVTVLAVPPNDPRFKQQWPYVAGVNSLPAASGAGQQPPTIAIVDSGIDAGRADFGGRVLEEVTITNRTPNSPGDGNGHGTAVASIAAGQAAGYAGAEPDANIVSIDVLDDDGVGNTSDVIAAADWIYHNRVQLNIRVANFSLHGTSLASLVSDPLDKAVERLWLSGIVVVAAAGNYATDGAESAVPFAPANDPFIVTVGATDTGGSFTTHDDVPAPWSAWGYTRDGFAKPEVVAPGRYIAAAVSSTGKLARDRPDRFVEPGYMQLSGTSLSAPMVAGIAARIVSRHPGWSPDHVKGALMLTTEPLPRAAPRSVGVGSVNAGAADAVVAPPNPNLALNQFLVPDPSGSETPVFDASAWTEVVATDPAWSSVAWGSVAWGSAAWSSVAWGSVAWGSVAWGSVAWGSVAWGSHERNDFHPDGGYWVGG